MNIMTIIILAVILQNELPELPEDIRANRRADRDRAIAHNKAIYNNRLGKGKWYDEKYHDYDHTQVKHPEWEGKFVGYHGSKITNKPQNGRWATERLSGHRRFQKWSRDYYPSFTDEKARQGWNDTLKDYYEG